MRYLSLLFFLSCVDIEDDPVIFTDYYEDCFFKSEKIHNIDLFQNYFTITLDNAFVPDFNFTDSILTDYYYFKFSNDSLNGTYVIVDANRRYKINTVQPYDSIALSEYPFSHNPTGENSCVYLDILRTEKCDCY